jgi:RNA polymerase sigma-70 factor (ECF subfamily)
MTEPDDIRALVELLRKGDEQAAQVVYKSYVNRLLPLVRQRLSQRMARRVDPEDVVQSVFRTFFTRVKAGRFVIEEQDDLSKLLVSITVRKTLRQVAYHKAAKRDPGHETTQNDSSCPALGDLLSMEPSPEATVVFLDQLEKFLKELNPRDRRILELRMEGYSNEQVARRLGKVDRTIRRIMEHIQQMAEGKDLLS